MQPIPLSAWNCAKKKKNVLFAIQDFKTKTSQIPMHKAPFLGCDMMLSLHHPLPLPSSWPAQARWQLPRAEKVQKLTGNRHSNIKYFIKSRTCDLVSALNGTISSNRRSRQPLWSHPRLLSATTAWLALEQTWLSASAAGFCWNVLWIRASEQNWKHTYSFSNDDTRRGKLLLPTGTILILVRVSI